MPTRTRTRRPSAAPKTEEQAEFNPEVIASGNISTGEERVNPEDRFYDSGADTDYNSSTQTPEIRGPHPDDGEDDGSMPEEVIDEVEEPVDEEPDPSAGQSLGRTVAGMTQGQQAAQAELKDYMRRMQNIAEEMGELRDDAKELKKEIKNKGYDLKAFALIFKLAGLDEEQETKLRDQKAINQTYAKAVGVDENLV